MQGHQASTSVSTVAAAATADVGTQGAATTATADESSTQANANDGSDDEESVHVTGVGFDDDLTSQAGGLKSVQQSDQGVTPQQTKTQTLNQP